MSDFLRLYAETVEAFADVMSSAFQR